MTLSPGARLGPYEIRTAIGAGGMGEVYRARDSRLARDVAVKTLPHAFVNDDKRLARFEREAKLLASLNHTNIAQIYGFEECDGMRALVMELVEGETLAARLAGGPIRRDHALGLARQILEALEAAHAQGIVHRDLKPANVRVRADGVLKVLDFGLSKAIQPDSGGLSSSHLPTLTEAGTAQGVILGTAAYMAPEQARGERVDARADIWGFGCVLFEMLAGSPAFKQATVAETLAAVLEREPDWSALPADTPPGLERLLRRCLEKQAARRWHSAADVRFAIEDALAAPSEAQASPRRGWRGATLPWLLALAAGAIAAATLATARRTSPTVPTLVLDVNAGPSRDPLSFALSPDGKQLAFVALELDVQQLWLRQLGQPAAGLVAATEGATQPFWSPDGRSIAFFADGLLKRLDLVDMKPRVLAHARNPMGGSWGSQGDIVYAPFGASPLMRIPATGGSPTPATVLAKGDVSHRFPAFLPDGRGFVFLSMRSGLEEEQGVYLASLGAREAPRRLLASDSSAEYAPPGYLVTVRASALTAVPFDAQKGIVVGEPIVVVPRVAARGGHGGVSVAASGLIGYRAAGAASPPPALQWVDRRGNVTSTLPLSGFVSLTRDGRRAAVARQTTSVTPNSDVWLFDTPGGGPARFTFDPAFDINPVWSPDGGSVVFASNRGGIFDLFEKPASFARDDRVLLASAENKYPQDWSPDGSQLLFVNESVATGDDLWVLSLAEPQRAVPFLNRGHAESQGQFSPDGHWIAYRSNESGRWEILLRRYPDSGGQRLVSKGGGVQPRWRADGKELFYVGADDQLMAVPIRLAGQGGEVLVGEPSPLFKMTFAQRGNMQFSYAVDPAGERFLVFSAPDPTSRTPITIMQSWLGLLQKETAMLRSPPPDLQVP